MKSLLGTPLLVSVVLFHTFPMNSNTPAAESISSRIATIVAAHDASPDSKNSARFVCDGEGDQEEINAAIRSLPESGGTVTLSEGRFDIRQVEGTLGGVIIERSQVTLSGQGAATRLVLAPHQNVNVIRIIGSGVGYITIRDLYVDANRAENADGVGDPKISHDRFEFSGIKAFRQAPRGPSAAMDTHHITIQNCHVMNAHRLGIMLEGPHMRVEGNVLGNAGSDSVEILTGPGVIRGNSVEITGQTHVAIGSDRANSIIMSDNQVTVKKGGALDIGFRSWAGSKRHVISNNIVTIEEGGRCELSMDIRGTETTITGNNVFSAGQPTRIRVTAGNAVLAANVLENVVVEIDDPNPQPLPIQLLGNVLHKSEVVIQRGNVVSESSSVDRK
ncbi:MAG: right-handed parallel beta-helix repeat-containing protein [Planctomycetes bacterium]|nr:right-handed parallel beta-helix repeat-containing protein [Planctomycetota bacterium]